MKHFAILPAAGRSQRMGTPKLLLPCRGRLVLETVLDVWSASRAAPVILVVHPADQELAEVGRRSGADVVAPAIPPADMKASVLAGLERIRQQHEPTAADRWLVAPADMPWLTTAAIDAVVTRGAQAPDQIVIPTYQGRRGHPVSFPWPRAREVALLAASAGLNALVAGGPVSEIEISEPGILADLDTPEDYERLLSETRDRRAGDTQG